jgi:hypothetical protein
MASEWKSAEERENDRLKAKVRLLVADLEKADSAKIPKMWEMGETLVAIEGTDEEKFLVAKGSNNYYRSIRLFRYFPTLDHAKAFRGTLKRALEAAEKGIKSRGARAIRFPEAAKRVEALVGNLWSRMPNCDHEKMTEFLASLAAKSGGSRMRGAARRGGKPRPQPVVAAADDGILSNTGNH